MAREVFAADPAREERALLVVFRGDGSVFSEKAVPHTGGASPTWNSSALTFWWPVCIRRSDQVDLLVNPRRRLMRLDVAQFISGQDATTLWMHEMADPRTGQRLWSLKAPVLRIECPASQWKNFRTRTESRKSFALRRGSPNPT
jgi:hypothetical protein